MTNSNAAPKDPDKVVAAKLAEMLKRLDLDKQIYREVFLVGKQVAESEGELKACDMSQLKAFAETTQRLFDCNALAKECMHSDPEMYLKLLPKIHSDGALQRGLLRDLKATKTSRNAGSGNSTKKKPNGATDWEGLL